MIGNASACGLRRHWPSRQRVILRPLKAFTANASAAPQGLEISTLVAVANRV